MYRLSDKQKEYLHKLYNALSFKVSHPTNTNAFKLIGYKVEMEFINRVLEVLYYTDGDRSRLNELAKVYRDVSK